MRGLLAVLFAGMACAQTPKIDYVSQVRNKPDLPTVVSDSNATYTTFALACAGAAGKTLVVGRVWTAVPAQTCPAALQFIAGGLIRPAANQTVTLSGNIDCQPYQQCFDTTASGAVIAFSKLPPAVYPDWWGAIPGASDSAAAFNAAGRAAGSSGKVHINPGSYSLATSFEVHEVNGFEVEGSGFGSNLRWTGNNSSPVVWAHGVFNSTFHDFSVSCGSAHPCAEGVESSNSLLQNSGHNTFKHLYVYALDSVANSMVNGIVVDGTDANNDFHHFEDNVIGGYTETAIVLSGSQSYSHYLANNILGVGVAAPREKYSLKALGGSTFSLYGGAVHSTVYDFYTTGISDATIRIQDVNGESTGNFLKVIGKGQGAMVLDGIRWSKIASTNTDTNFINYVGGTLSILNSKFENGSGNATTQQLTILFQWAGSTFNPLSLTIKDTLIYNSAAAGRTTLDGLLNYIVGPPTGSNSNPASYISLSHAAYIDYAGPSGVYGGEVSFPAMTTLPTIFTVNNPVTQNVITVSNFRTQNTVLTTYTEFTGGTTGQIIYVTVGDTHTVFSQAATFLNLGTATISAVQGRTYVFYCQAGVGDATASYWQLISPL